MANKLLKNVLNAYFSLSCRLPGGVDWNLFIIKIFYKIFRAYPLSDRLAFLFQYNYARTHAKPVLKHIALKNDIHMMVNVIDRLGGLLYFYRNYSERKTQEFLNTHLKEGDTFIDVGANCGFFSLLAAKKVGSTGKVYAFEPNPQVVEVFKQSIEINQLSSVITLENIAVSDQSGKQLNFYLPSDRVNSAIGTLVARNDVVNNGNNAIQVSTISLDNYLKDKYLPGNLFIKIDVEGNEDNVLKGAHQLLEQQKPFCIVIESASEHSDCCQQLKRYGYQLAEVDLFNHYDQFGNYLFIS